MVPAVTYQTSSTIVFLFCFVATPTICLHSPGSHVNCEKIQENLNKCRKLSSTCTSQSKIIYLGFYSYSEKGILNLSPITDHVPSCNFPPQLPFSKVPQLEALNIVGGKKLCAFHIDISDMSVLRLRCC